jgi:hypothetical protein
MPQTYIGVSLSFTCVMTLHPPTPAETTILIYMDAWIILERPTTSVSLLTKNNEKAAPLGADVSGVFNAI